VKWLLEGWGRSVVKFRWIIVCVARYCSGTAIKELLMKEEAIESVYTWLDAPEEMKAQFQNEQGNVTIGFIEMNIDEGFAQKVLPEIQERVSASMQSQDVDVTILGAPALWGEVNAASQAGLAIAHLYAIPIVILVLLLVFRSVVSSLMPLLLAEADPSSPQYIETIWGVGYRFIA